MADKKKTQTKKVKAKTTKDLQKEILKDMPKPTQEDLVREKIIIFLKTMDGYANEANLYLDSHFKYLLDNMDEDDEKNWAVFSTFLYNFTHLTQTYRDLGNYLIGEKDEESSSKQQIDVKPSVAKK